MWWPAIKIYLFSPANVYLVPQDAFTSILLGDQICQVLVTPRGNVENRKLPRTRPKIIFFEKFKVLIFSNQWDLFRLRLPRVLHNGIIFECLFCSSLDQTLRLLLGCSRWGSWMQPNPNFMCLPEQLCTLGFHTHVSLVMWLKIFRLFVMCDIFWRHSRYVLCISGERYVAKHQAWAGFHSWREVSLLDRDRNQRSKNTNS